MSAHNFRDRTGETYGRLHVISFEGRNKFRNALWKCKCECGAVAIVAGGALNRTLSCGCLRIERTIKAKTTHGMCRTPTYKTWESILRRCTNQNDPSFVAYGARGITVCDKWKTFEGFFEDMGHRPAGMTIDRIKGSEGYFKKNCRWATPSGQARNRRSNRIITFRGESLCVAEWSERTGIKRGAIEARLKYGWSVEKTLTQPVQ